MYIEKGLTYPIPFCIHFHVTLVNPPATKATSNERRQLRRTATDNLAVLVSAVGNSGGGAVLVHIDGVSTDDKYHGYFDEMVDEKLHGLIENGALFSNAYKKIWLESLDSESTYWGYLLLVVAKGQPFVTANLNTAITLDDRILQATGTVVRTILQNKNEFASTPNSRGHKHDNETFNIQTKRFEPKIPLPETSHLTDYIWHTLRLREYLSAFAKCPDGGSFYVGIEEQDTTKDGYKSKVLSSKGIDFRLLVTEKQRDACMDQLKRRCVDEMLFCTYEGHFERPKEASFKILFHYLENSRYILEVAVCFMPGILFYDPKGTRSLLLGPPKQYTQTDYPKRLVQKDSGEISK